MIRSKWFLLSLLQVILVGMFLTACSNDKDFTSPPPEIPVNADNLILARNAGANDSRGYVRFSHATHNTRPQINNDCMVCHIHTAVTVSPSWPCAQCHGPGGIAAGAEVCINQDITDHGLSCIARACVDCHTTLLAGSGYIDPANSTDCHYCHADEGEFLESFLGGVQGLVYQTTDFTSKTNTRGQFEFFLDETITFSVSSVVLGSILIDSNTFTGRGWEIITPVDLVPGSDTNDSTVLNITRFLMTIDTVPADNTKIIIPSDIAAVLAGRSIDFSVSTAAFELDPVIVDIVAHYGSLVSAAAAKTLLDNTIARF